MAEETDQYIRIRNLFAVEIIAELVVLVLELDCVILRDASGPDSLSNEVKHLVIRISLFQEAV